MSHYSVKVIPGGVRFQIDHQAFDLRILAEGKHPPTRERCRWYARQLRTALKRLAGGKP